MTQEDLSKSDIVLCIDRSGSMNYPASGANSHQSRWQQAEEICAQMAAMGAKYDDDGITVCFFSDSFTEFVNIDNGIGKVQEIFTKQNPGGGTDTALVLNHYFNDYITRKKNGTVKPMLIAVVTDGIPNDEEALKRAIVDVTKKLDSGEELQVHFFQVGDDEHAQAFLKRLDIGLKGIAKYDIVGVRTHKELESITAEEAILANDE
jgi:uncharacterized protein with von Willebrand factor type A (vWA) domain